MKNTLKNLLAENMLRFGTKNLSESEIEKINLTEQTQITFEAIQKEVDAMSKQINALAKKEGVDTSVVGHLILHQNEQAKKRGDYAGLYFVNDFNYKKMKAGGSIQQGSGGQYSGDLMTYGSKRPDGTPVYSAGSLQGKFIKGRDKIFLKSAMSQGLPELRQWYRQARQIILTTSVAGEKNVFHALAALGAQM